MIWKWQRHSTVWCCFSLNPSDAELYIDGSQVDASQPVTLEYGIHQIIAKADGYSRLHSILQGGAGIRGVDVQLDKADSDSEDSTESSSSSSSSATESTSTADTTTTYYRVHIDAPEKCGGISGRQLCGEFPLQF